jgi:hypothetical protein
MSLESLDAGSRLLVCKWHSLSSAAQPAVQASTHICSSCTSSELHSKGALQQPAPCGGSPLPGGGPPPQSGSPWWPPRRAAGPGGPVMQKQEITSKPAIILAKREDQKPWTKLSQRPAQHCEWKLPEHHTSSTYSPATALSRFHLLACLARQALCLIELLGRLLQHICAVSAWLHGRAYSIVADTYTGSKRSEDCSEHTSL